MKKSKLWTRIPGFKNHYKICCSTQEVKSLSRWVRNGGGKRLVKEKILKPVLSKGYLKVSLCKNGKIKNYRIHTLMLIPNKEKVMSTGMKLSRGVISRQQAVKLSKEFVLYSEDGNKYLQYWNKIWEKFQTKGFSCFILFTMFVSGCQSNSDELISAQAEKVNRQSKIQHCLQLAVEEGIFSKIDPNKFQTYAWVDYNWEILTTEQKEKTAGFIYEYYSNKTVLIMDSDTGKSIGEYTSNGLVLK